MDSGFISSGQISQSSPRNSQKFDRDDACYLKSNPALLGHVARTPYDVDEHEPLADLLVLRYTEIPENDLMSFMATEVPPKGYVFIIFVEPSHGCALVHENDLELMDRALDLGQTVKRHLDDTISGTIISTSAQCILEPIAFQPVDPLTGDYGPLRFTEKPLNNISSSQSIEPPEPSPPLLYDIPLSELTRYEEFTEGDYVIYRQKLGVIQEIERDAVLLLPNLNAVSPLEPYALEVPLCSNPKSVISLPDGDTLKSHDIGNGEHLWTSEAELIYPGQTTLTSASNINRGDLPPGFQGPLVQGFVLATPAMDIHIDWLCPNVFSAGSHHRGPNSEVLRASVLQGSAVKCDFDRTTDRDYSPQRPLYDTRLEIGERVRFRDMTCAARYPGYRHIPADQTFGYDLNIFRVVSSKTVVAVQWQDGSITAEEATSLHISDGAEDELWPGNLVVLEDKVEPIYETFTSPAELFSYTQGRQMGNRYRIPQVGVVQAVDSRERIATVRWYRNAEVELMHDGNVLNPCSSLGELGNTVTKVSLYELTSYRCLSRFLNQLVILAPDSIDQSVMLPPPAQAPRKAAGPCQMSFLSPVTFRDLSLYLQSMKSEMIKSEWFQNTTTVNATPLARRYSVHNDDIGGRSPVNFFGKITAIDTSGSITVRLPGARACHDISVSPERILLVIDLQDSVPPVPLQSLNFFDIAANTSSWPGGQSFISRTFEYEGGVLPDHDSADEDWTTEAESEDSTESDELIPVPERMTELGKVGGNEQDMTAVTEISSTNVPESNHDGDASVKNLAFQTSPEPNLPPILCFPIPASCPPGFAVLEDLPPPDHNFIHDNVSGLSAAPRMKRIQKEFDILESALPPGIFVRTWESRIDLMRVMILGPEGTPYEHAPFLIDLHFNSEFPNCPPSTFFHSWTTGQGPVNPNLYENGKICLSILGTWHTENPDETWSPLKSTVLQILVSIMGLVLVKAPFYNEAGYEVLAVEDNRHVESSQYTERTFLMTRKFIQHALEHPVPGLEDVLTWHYLPGPTSNRPQLLRKAINEALGMIQHHNCTSPEQTGEVPTASAFVSRLSLGAVVMLRKHITALEMLESDIIARGCS